MLGRKITRVRLRHFGVFVQLLNPEWVIGVSRTLTRREMVMSGASEVPAASMTNYVMRLNLPEDSQLNAEVFFVMIQNCSWLKYDFYLRTAMAGMLRKDRACAACHIESLAGMTSGLANLVYSFTTLSGINEDGCESKSSVIDLIGV